jgi:type I restriction enzyme R subunit
MAMCRDLFQYLIKAGSPEQKTVIFCVRDSHADAVAIEMNNLYAEWCEQNHQHRVEPYAFKCTAASGGSDYLPDLRGSSRSHFIATTVELLTTGVDVPVLRNVAFFRYMKSPISFYQMVGRGSRIDLPSGKLMFSVYDYTDATCLFGEDFFTKPTHTSVPIISGEDGDGNGGKDPPLVISVDGFDVHITEKGKFVVVMEDGKARAMPYDEYRQRLAQRLREVAPTLDDFRKQWVDTRRRKVLVYNVVQSGFSPALVRSVDGMGDYDLYDVLAGFTYKIQPRTRRQRAEAFRVQNAGWLAYLPPRTGATLAAIAQQFTKAGTEGLESNEIFQTPMVAKAGGLAALREAGNPVELVIEAKARLFSL